MIATALLAAMIPPALPPFGPVRGSLECLLDFKGGQESAHIWFDESNAQTQVFLHGLFPLDADSVGRIEVGSASILVFDQINQEVLYRFDRVKVSKNGEWWAYRTEKSSGSANSGICFGQFLGRADRPISFTRIGSVKVEVVQ